MDAGTTSLVIVGGLIPFVAYGVAGVWKHWKVTRPVDPKAILAERFARGEIDDDEYARRLSLLTYGPPLFLDAMPTIDVGESPPKLEP